MMSDMKERGRGQRQVEGASQANIGRYQAFGWGVASTDSPGQKDPAAPRTGNRGLLLGLELKKQPWAR